jgi:hypothetical protein
MALYRQDIQYGIPLYEAPDGFYWCTQVWYFQASTPSEYTTARNGAARICTEGLNTNVLVWSCTVRDWPANTLIEHFVPSYDHPYLSGPFDPPTLTVYVGLLHEGRQVGFKRVRSPVRHQDYNADLSLTPWALNYYQTTFQQIADYGCFCNCNGVIFDEVRVLPRVVSWQLRRGTRRRWERRPLY